MTQRNLTQVIQEIYKAFGEGNLPFILDRVDDHMQCGYNVSTVSIPLHKPAKNKAEFGEFFKLMATDMEFHQFQPHAFFENGNQVAVHLTLEYTVKKTGKKVKTDHIHLWTFNDKNKVAKLVHFEDTAAVIAAWKA